MKVFISWSGNLSQSIAVILKDWLQSVVQASDPWMSSEDIEAGSLWFGEISKEIKETKFGILCLTPENVSADWILWEAGAIYRGLEEQQRVVPLAVGFPKEEISTPLGMFQAKSLSNEADVLSLVSAINARTAKPLSETLLGSSFDKFWPDLTEAVSEAVKANSSGRPPPKLKDSDILKEILSHVKALRAEQPEASKTLTIPPPDPFVLDFLSMG